MSEREQDDQRDETDESPEEFAEEMESDPSRAPDDEGSGVDELRGG
jgi:hypothetical protein